MSCKHCKNWSTDYGFCCICSCKPPTTGNPATCPYYKPKVG